jgi:hypothetical protein
MEMPLLKNLYTSPKLQEEAYVSELSGRAFMQPLSFAVRLQIESPLLSVRSLDKVVQSAENYNLVNIFIIIVELTFVLRAKLLLNDTDPAAPQPPERKSIRWAYPLVISAWREKQNDILCAHL